MYSIPFWFLVHSMGDRKVRDFDEGKQGIVYFVLCRRDFVCCRETRVLLNRVTYWVRM